MKYMPFVAIELCDLVFVFEGSQTDNAGVGLFALLRRVFVLLIPNSLHCGLSKRHSIYCIAHSDFAVLSVNYDYQHAEAARNAATKSNDNQAIEDSNNCTKGNKKPVAGSSRIIDSTLNNFFRKKNHARIYHQSRKEKSIQNCKDNLRGPVKRIWLIDAKADSHNSNAA